MEDREIENFKTLQKKKDRYASNGNGTRGNGITSSDGVSSRNRIQQLMESANGVPPIRARYRNSRKTEAKNDSDNGKHKQGKNTHGLHVILSKIYINLFTCIVMIL